MQVIPVTEHRHRCTATHAFVATLLSFFFPSSCHPFKASSRTHSLRVSFSFLLSYQPTTKHELDDFKTFTDCILRQHALLLQRKLKPSSPHGRTNVADGFHCYILRGNPFHMSTTIWSFLGPVCFFYLSLSTGLMSNRLGLSL
jgi:hypothetical protein